MDHKEKYHYIKNRISEIMSRTHPPEHESFLELIAKVNAVLTSEKYRTRPHDQSGLPGGVVLLNFEIPTIIISDIHARLDYIKDVLFSDVLKYSVLDKLILGQAQIVAALPRAARLQVLFAKRAEFLLGFL